MNLRLLQINPLKNVSGVVHRYDPGIWGKELSTGFSESPCQNGCQRDYLFRLILNQHFEILKSLNPRHNNKFVVWITLKIIFPWNLIKSYIIYKTKPRLVGGRKIHSGYISKILSLAGLKLLHWNHLNGIFWLCNKVALSLFNFTVLSAVSCFLLHWQLCSHLIR